MTFCFRSQIHPLCYIRYINPIFFLNPSLKRLNRGLVSGQQMIIYATVFWLSEGAVVVSEGTNGPHLILSALATNKSKKNQKSIDKVIFIKANELRMNYPLRGGWSINQWQLKSGHKNIIGIHGRSKTAWECRKCDWNLDLYWLGVVMRAGSDNKDANFIRTTRGGTGFTLQIFGNFGHKHQFFGIFGPM